MTAKIDLKKHGGKVKGAGDVPATAAGNAPATGMPRPASPDVISTPKAAHSGYGQNNYAGPASLTPKDDSNKGVSPLAANMKAAGERGSDSVLDTIAKDGTAKPAPDWQTRKVSTEGYPPAHGMRNRSGEK
jgi:hypothetical protein